METLESRLALDAVAAYGFDEGTGSTLGDATGNGHTGAITGATWSGGGRFGGALSFDGWNDWVTVADAADLDLSTGMTLEAWVFPTSINDWETIVLKEQPGGLAYALYGGAPGNGPPAAYITRSGGGGDVGADGATPLPMGAWSHVASTYDGTTIRLYVDGVLVSSQAAAGTIVASASPLRIGGNAVWGEYFAGLIDEVRIYDRPLSVAEIQVDMNLPVSGTLVVTLASPSGAEPLSNVVELVATVNDETDIVGVDFFADGVLLGTDAAAPFAIGWNTTGIANGTRQITAVARDVDGGETASAPVSVDVLNPAFANEVVVPGVVTATTIAFLPDRRMLIGELTNVIWVVQPGASEPDPVPFLDLDYTFLFGEQGVYDIAVDPNFAANGYLYVFYTQGHPGPDNRDTLSRFTAVGNTADIGSELVLWQDDVTAHSEHHGGAIGFGLDGKLYFTTGDHFDPLAAQRLDSNRGKIMRINSDGSIPADNPFHDGSGPNRDAIWAYGLRNPFRMSIDSVTGRMYIADVGGNDANTAIEEVNAGERGANYGWPLGEGDFGGPGTTPPIYSYPHNGRDASITGGFVYRGSEFPSEFYGSYFFGDYVQNNIRRLSFDADGNVRTALDFLPADGALDTAEVGDLAKFVEGPDGAIYYIDVGFDDHYVPNAAAVRRIRYTPADGPPTAVANADVTFGSSPLVVSFSSVGSTDPEGQALSYSWTFGDGGTSSEANPTHTYQSTGQYTARLSVSDGANSTLSDDVLIEVGATPVPTIVGPADLSLFRAGDAIDYVGTATDADDGVLPPSAFSWRILFHHLGHVHPAGGPFDGVTGGTLVIPSSGHDFQDDTSYEISLTVTDSSGLTGTTSVTVFPDKVDLTFDTVPSGLTLEVDGIAKTTPFAIDDLIGFQHTINAPNQAGFSFASWSDGGSQNHGIVVPESDQAYVATFDASQPAGVIAAYGFDEGTGSTLGDATGNGHTGAISGAAWSGGGRFGGALSFDGWNDWVTVADAADLDLSTGMTLEAWVFPTSINDWETIVLKEQPGGLAYALYGGAPGNGPPAAYITRSGGGGDVGADGATPLPMGAWSHVASTYDGTTIRLYVDGVLVSSQAAAGTIVASASPLRIGGNAVWGEYFAGLIDEVRIYDRPLSVAEIQVDMNLAVGGAPLVVAGGIPRNDVTSITVADVLDVRRVALDYWRDVGLGRAQLNALQRLAIRVADLPGDSIGYYSMGTITLDRDAAGRGWNLGETRRAAESRADLFGALLHEMGHSLGLDHSLDADSPMADRQVIGKRAISRKLLVDKVFDELHLKD